jgi:glutamate synthase (NADPH/NADH) large chain
VLTDYELEKIRSIDTGIFQAKTLQCYFRADGKPGSLKAGLSRLCRYAEDAVNDDFKVLILQDRRSIRNTLLSLPYWQPRRLHHHLIRKGMRGQVGIIVEAGDIWEVHHFACLVGFGCYGCQPIISFFLLSKT